MVTYVMFFQDRSSILQFCNDNSGRRPTCFKSLHFSRRIRSMAIALRQFHGRYSHRSWSLRTRGPVRFMRTAKFTTRMFVIGSPTRMGVPDPRTVRERLCVTECRPKTNRPVRRRRRRHRTTSNGRQVIRPTAVAIGSNGSGSSPADFLVLAVTLALVL